MPERATRRRSRLATSSLTGLRAASRASRRVCLATGGPARTASGPVCCGACRAIAGFRARRTAGTCSSGLTLVSQATSFMTAGAAAMTATSNAASSQGLCCVAIFRAAPRSSLGTGMAAITLLTVCLCGALDCRVGLTGRVSPGSSGLFSQAGRCSSRGRSRV